MCEPDIRYYCNLIVCHDEECYDHDVIVDDTLTWEVGPYENYDEALERCVALAKRYSTNEFVIIKEVVEGDPDDCIRVLRRCQYYTYYRVKNDDVVEVRDDEVFCEA